MASPKTKREVQRLNGRVVALNRFIQRCTDKFIPFYDTLRRNKKFEWSEECEKAFRQLKHYLTTPPVIAKPVEGKPLFLYIAVSTTALSSVLIREERGERKPIFYVSKTLTDAETRYPLMENLALVVVVSVRKLRPYFHIREFGINNNMVRILTEKDIFESTWEWFQLILRCSLQIPATRRVKCLSVLVEHQLILGEFAISSFVSICITSSLASISLAYSEARSFTQKISLVEAVRSLSKGPWSTYL